MGARVLGNFQNFRQKQIKKVALRGLCSIMSTFTILNFYANKSFCFGSTSAQGDGHIGYLVVRQYLPSIKGKIDNVFSKLDNSLIAVLLAFCHLLFT